MPAYLNNAPKEQNLEGEVISFYGDLVSINPKDADFHLSSVESSTVLSYVKEHNESRYFTMMYAEKPIPEDLQKDILSINPHTRFMHIEDIEEFANYYDNGSKEMDRELHPVESVRMLARQDVLYYDVKEREKHEVKAEAVHPREYIKATDISSNEMMRDLIQQINKVTHLKDQEFLDSMGLKDDANSLGTQSMINAAKTNLKNEFFRDYALPQAGKTAVDSIDKVIPSMPTKSIKEGIEDGIEFVYDMVGDKDKGHLKIEYSCTSLSDCHIKGVYREIENEKMNDKNLSKVDENGVILENSASKTPDEMVSYISKNIEAEQTNTQSFDSDTKAQEIVANMNLPEYDNSMEYNNSMDYNDIGGID